MPDFSDMARGIIDANRYMVLGTGDEDGVPWVTPCVTFFDTARQGHGLTRRWALAEPPIERHRVPSTSEGA